MSDAAVLVATYVLNAGWQILPVGGAGWIASQMLRPLGPQCQHRVWVVTLCFAALVPLASLWGHVGDHQASGAIQRHVPLALQIAVDQTPSDSGADIVLPLPLIQALAGLYLVALAYFALRFCWMIGCTASVIWGASPVALSPERLELWNSAAKSLGIKNAAFLSSQHISGPLTAGFTHPVLLVPQDFIAATSPPEFLSVIGHECAHMQRHDFHKNLFYESLSLFISFHPVTWLMKARLAITREMACDRLVTQKLVQPRTYALSLIRLAGRIAAPASLVRVHGIGIFDRNALEDRIMLVNANNSRVSGAFSCYLTIIAALVWLIFVGVSGALTRSLAAQTPSRPSPLSDKTGEVNPDLSCTYYDHPQIVGHEGTCGFDNSTKSYRCFSNKDNKLSNPQIACEGRVRRARAKGSAGQSPHSLRNVR